MWRDSISLLLLQNFSKLHLYYASFIVFEEFFFQVFEQYEILKEFIGVLGGIG